MSVSEVTVLSPGFYEGGSDGEEDERERARREKRESVELNLASACATQHQTAP